MTETFKPPKSALSRMRPVPDDIPELPKRGFDLKIDPPLDEENI